MTPAPESNSGTRFLSGARWQRGSYVLQRVLLIAIVILFALAIEGLLINRLVFIQDFHAHYAYLADAFVHGTFAVDSLPSRYNDKVFFGGHIYLPLGPLPGILLMPIAFFLGAEFQEYPIVLLLSALNIWLLYESLKRLEIPRELHRWLLLLFFAGTLYLSVVVQGNSWFLAQVLTVTWLLGIIAEMLGKRRMWLVGFLLGAAFLTRTTTVFSAVFVGFLLWRDKQLDLRRIVQVGLGFLPALVFFVWYNFARFGSPFETGYGLAELPTPVLTAARSAGLFSPVHLPKNLYMLLLAMPQPVPDWNAPILKFPYIAPSVWGMGILFTTPLFIYALRAQKTAVVTGAWLATICIGIPLLFYYGIGWVQFGYRYALDFYPFLFIAAAMGLAWHWTPKLRYWILLCVIINIWGGWVSLLGGFAF